MHRYAKVEAWGCETGMNTQKCSTEGWGLHVLGGEAVAFLCKARRGEGAQECV